MRAKITDALVRTIEVPSKGYSLVWDQELKGFGLRVTAAGARSFLVSYAGRDGSERRMTLGRYPALSVVAARKLALEAKGKSYAGGDPLAERIAARQTEAVPDLPTLQDLRDRYFTEHVRVRRTAGGQQNEGTYWRAALAHLGAEKPVENLTKLDVQQMHQSLKATPTQANRVVTSLATALRLAVEWGWIAQNPAIGVHKNPESSRERFLTDGEAVRLRDAIDAHPERASALAISLLLLTGARRGELLSARWSDIDLASGIWAKPAATTKARRVHRVILSKAATATFSKLKELSAGSPFVFPGKGNTPQASVKRSWASIRKAADLEGFRLHDLRHSHASFIARSGGSLLVIGRALGHSQPSTTLRYSHLTETAMKAAAESVAGFSLGDGTEGSE